MNILYEHRADMAKFTPPGSQKALDIGCNSGRLGEYLRTLGITEVVGVDISEHALTAAAPYEDRIHILNVEKDDIPYPDHYFDVMFCGDVLEHLVNPNQFLIRYKRYIKPTGLVIGSIPNIGHFSVLRRILLSGKFYEDAGLTDRTHLRFFTKHSAIGLFEEHGYKVVSVDYNYDYQYGKILETQAQVMQTAQDFLQSTEPTDQPCYLTENVLLFVTQFVLAARPLF